MTITKRANSPVPFSDVPQSTLKMSKLNISQTP